MPDKSGNYEQLNPKHEIVKENQKAKVKMQNDKATVNKRLKCKNTEQR